MCPPSGCEQTQMSLLHRSYFYFYERNLVLKTRFQAVRLGMASLVPKLRLASTFIP